MKTFGLIGFPLTHSFSQKYFTEKFRDENIAAEYLNLPIQNISEIKLIIKNNPSLCGLNVTIPHKQTVIPFLDELDETAKKVGAVNCIKIIQKSEIRNQKLKGFNTDVLGFENSLKKYLQSHHTKALILGNGGAARAVEYVLNKIGIEYFIVSRKKTTQINNLCYSDLNEEIINSHPLIINTTPLGMFPEISSFPNIPYQFISKKNLLFDLIYNPEETLFMKKGKEKNATVVNGLEMLKLQAERAWEIWNE